MTLSARLSVNLSADQQGGNNYDDDFRPIIKQALSLLNGTGLNQADLIYADQRTVLTGANDDIDLSGGLTDAFGVTITMVELVAMMIINAPSDPTVAANTTDLTIGAGANPFVGFLGATHTIGPIKPGGAMMLFAGDASGLGTVVAATGDILRVANSAGATALYQVALIGRSA